MYRQRFGLTGHPLPKNAQGKTFFDKTPGYKKLSRAFAQLAKDPGLAVATADAGGGKTAAIRNLCGQRPQPAERPAGRDDVVFRLKFNDGALGACRLLP